MAKKSFFQKMGTMTLAMIPIGVAINFVGAQIANNLKLPMYLDSIGTFLVASVCGPVPGAITGAINSLISAISWPTAVAYLPVVVIYGLVVGWLAKRKWMTKISTVILTGLVIAAGGVLLATPITALIFGGITETGQSVIIVALQSIGFSLIPATLISGVITELLDKTISMLITFGLIKVISDRYLSKLPLGPLYYKKDYKKAYAVEAKKDEED
jgi:energy-coupling factor transport system substrate-specific component